VFRLPSFGQWRQQRRLRLTYAAPSAARLVQGLALVVAVGTLALMLPGVSTGRPLRFDQALFTATSAASVTGLSVIVPSQDLTLLGQLMLMLLIQAGGVGFMMLAVFMIVLLGRKVSLADRLALQDSLGLSLPRAVVRIAGRTVIGVLAIEALGALLLWWHWTPQLGSAKALWFGIFHAVSAFCNAGFDLWTGTAGYTGIPTDAITLTILGTLIVAGGLGIPVWGDILFNRRRWSLHTRVTLVASAVLIVGGGVAILFAEHRAGGLLHGQPWNASLPQALFQSVSARTAGFAALSDLSQLTPASQWLITGLMFVGTAPASMGGGITTGTLAILVLAMVSYARGLPQAQVGMRSISQQTIGRAVAVLTVSFILVATTTWLLLMTQAVTLDDALFSTVSAFATTGLATAPMTDFNWFGRLLLMAMMFWGRLGALTIVLAMARQTPPQPISYPEDTLLLG
jgi:trk system potassium uptake protein TrkH